MNKHLIISAFLILLFYQSISQTTFFRIYKSPEYNTMFSASETTANEFILCGRKDNLQGSNFPNAQLFKIGADGNIIQEKVFESNLIQSSFSTLRKTISNSDIFHLTGKVDSVSGDSIFHLIKLWEIDDNLNFLKEYTLNFGDSVNNLPQSFVNVNDSLIYFLSALFRPQYSNNDFSLVKLNLYDGNVNTYFPPQHAFRIPSNFTLDTINQQLRVLCAGSSLKSKGIVRTFSFDMDLNYISEFEPDINFTSITCRLSNYYNDSHIISGNILKPSGVTGLYNFVFNNNNELIDSVALFSSADTLTYPGSGNSILVADSSIWSVGIYNIDPSTFWQPDPTWIQLSKMNSSFELTEQFYYGGDGMYIPYDIISTSDGGILVTGNYYNPNAVPLVHQRDPFVLKVNKDGLIVNIDDPQQPIAQEALVFPNPGTEFLQVKLAIQHKSAHIQLIDIGGRLVLETDLTGDLQQVETSQLGPGTFIYRITASNRVIGSGKWVKQ